jgi:hypothetical protein
METAVDQLFQRERDQRLLLAEENELLVNELHRLQAESISLRLLASELEGALVLIASGTSEIPPETLAGDVLRRMDLPA